MYGSHSRTGCNSAKEAIEKVVVTGEGLSCFVVLNLSTEQSEELSPRTPPLPATLSRLLRDPVNFLSHPRTIFMDPGLGPDEIAPIALLMDELRSEDVQLRLNAIHRISTIALALGPDRAREELIVFLQDSVDDEDEVLLALAEELGKNFEEYIGGPQYAHVLLGPLENLSAVEETLVRDKAAESITKVAAVLSQEQIEQYYIPLLTRLTRGEWFTSRTSSAALYAPVYAKVSPGIQEDLRKGYAQLASDDTPMVRRAAAKWLGAFAKDLSKQHVLSEGLAIYRRLQADDQDSVRLLTVEDLVVIAKQLSPAEVKEQLLKQIRQSISDKSWRVRYMAATHFNALSEAVGVELVREELVGHYVQLLKDNEAEVRTAAAGQIPGFSNFLEREVVIARIIPFVRELCQDSSQHVRAALAIQITGLAPLLGNDATIEHLLPLFLHLLKDEEGAGAAENRTRAGRAEGGPGCRCSVFCNACYTEDAGDHRGLRSSGERRDWHHRVSLSRALACFSSFLCHDYNLWNLKRKIIYDSISLSSSCLLGASCVGRRLAEGTSTASVGRQSLIAFNDGSHNKSIWTLAGDVLLRKGASHSRKAQAIGQFPFGSPSPKALTGV
ncbi:ARM repeat-containing protein [Artomyces pyxidatus]|uniref:ARM repeat-containing protein n=1 Tax=Artomyces pyxidatus TaxID=48021 RepID=A0ACB8THZ8_9AGAM|nr:ARM repeat-containing protein [Artomyces pyxidatus]